MKPLANPILSFILYPLALLLFYLLTAPLFFELSLKYDPEAIHGPFTHDSTIWTKASLYYYQPCQWLTAHLKLLQEPSTLYHDWLRDTLP